jgi:hypothetical protein
MVVRGKGKVKQLLFGKCVAAGIIFLFIGVAVAPSINFNVVKAANDNDFVEVTSQACGIRGYENTTVKLTRQQYRDLEQYLVEFRARLNQTTTREQMIPLYKEAVVELNKYGLLPKGMSVEQAQRLVVGENQQNWIHRLSNNKQMKSLFPNYINVLCLLCALFIPGENPDCFTFSSFLLLIAPLLDLFPTFGLFLGAFLLILGLVSPIKIMHFMGFKNYDIFMASCGLNGFVNERRNNLVILGFTGFSLMTLFNNKPTFLLGFCFAIDHVKE